MHSPKYTLFLKQNNWHFCHVKSQEHTSALHKHTSFRANLDRAHFRAFQTEHSKLISFHGKKCLHLWGNNEIYFICENMGLCRPMPSGFALLGLLFTRHWGLIDLLIMIILFIDENFTVEANSSSWLITRNWDETTNLCWKIILTLVSWGPKILCQGAYFIHFCISFNFLSELSPSATYSGMFPKGSPIPSHPFSSKVNSLNLGNFSSLFPCCPNSSNRDCKWIYKHFLQLSLFLPLLLNSTSYPSLQKQLVLKHLLFQWICAEHLLCTSQSVEIVVV